MTPARLLSITLVLLALASRGTAWGQSGPAVRTEALRAEIDALAERIDAGRAERDEATAALERTEKVIVTLAAERDELAGQIDAIEARIGKLDAATADAAERLPLLRGELDEALRTRYRLARTTRASILFDREDPARAQRMLTYFDHLLEAQTRRIDELTVEIDAIVSARDELAAQRDALTQARRGHDDKVAALKSRQAERGAQLEAIRRRLASDASLLADKREEKARLNQLLEGIEKLRREAPPEMPAPSPAPEPTSTEVAPTAPPAPDGTAPATLRLDGLAHLKGELPLPVGGRVITRFREPDTLSGVPSSGVVIEAGEGADVRSISAGQVVYSGWFRGYGLLLVIDHGDGYMSLYGYNSRLLYPIGAAVAAGVPVARAGSTGGRARAGVYFEIRRGGDAVDPLEWCRTRTG